MPDKPPSDNYYEELRRTRILYSYFRSFLLLIGMMVTGAALGLVYGIILDVVHRWFVWR